MMIILFGEHIMHDELCCICNSNGEDKIGNGLTPFFFLKVLTMHAQYIEDNIPRDKPTKSKSSWRKICRTCPLLLFPLCVVMGDELRTTRIELTVKKRDYVAGDYTYMQNIMQYLMTLYYPIYL